MSKAKILYDKILALSIQQLDLIQKDEWEKDQLELLDEILNKRQQLLDQIDKINMESNSAEYNNQSSQEDYRHTILEIQENDNQSRVMLEQAMKKTNHKLARARQSKKAYKAYDQGDSYSQPWFYDKKK